MSILVYYSLSYLLLLINPLLHPRLTKLGVASVLLAAPGLSIPLVVTSFASVMFECRAVATMLQRVWWTRFPFHDSVLFSDFDVLSGSECSDSTHAVPLFIASLDRNTSLIEYLVVVVWT